MSRRLINRHLNSTATDPRYRTWRDACDKTYWLVLRQFTSPEASPPEAVAREVWAYPASAGAA